MADKYNQKDRDKMAKAGQAMSDGSYPIADAEDLDNAIHAVGRGGADHDKIRKHIIGRAKALGLSSKIPDNWNSDGTMKQSDGPAPHMREEFFGVVERRGRSATSFELRESPNGTGGSVLTFTGYASVVEAPYRMSDFFGEYTETIARGAFDRTLAEGPDLNFLTNHEGVAMARTKAGTLDLNVDDVGLHVEARLNPKRPDVQILRAAIEDKALDEMSFAFRVNKDGQEWSEDYDERRITSVNLHHGDVSAVNFGASQHTAGLVGIRALDILEREVRSGQIDPAVLSRVERLYRAAHPDSAEPVVDWRGQNESYTALAYALGKRWS